MRMRIAWPRRTVALAVALGLALGVVAYGAVKHPPAVPVANPLSATPSPPSELEHAQVQKDLEHLQLLQSQMQVLTYQFNETKAQLQVKLKALERDGYDLDLQAWTYVKKGAAPATK